jgi:long-subunit acyl-CoA synthetase (AMP-forming)
VGGAVCSKGLLLKAQQLKLPVYEGYGISECGSVISLNTNPKNIGSVGKVLPHQQLKLNPDNEIMVRGNLFLGYIGQNPEDKMNDDRWYATGDLGSLDEKGNLTIVGRKKKLIINSYGRNISPEWIEAELLSINDIYQCVVYGETQPYLTAICVAQVKKDELWDKIKKLNGSLPDYAQIKQIIISQQPFTVENKMLNASGTLNLQQIFKHFKQHLKEIYANT